MSGGGTGKGGASGGGGSTSNFGSVDLTPGLESTGANIQSKYDNLGLGNSTMATQDQVANKERVDATQQELDLQNQLAVARLANSAPTGGFSAGVNSTGAGGIGSAVGKAGLSVLAK